MIINWKDIGIRCIKTFIQAITAYLTLSLLKKDDDLQNIKFIRRVLK